MKFVFIIALISFFTLSASAQTVAMANPKNDTQTTQKVDKELLKKRHTRAAIQQIHVHLQNHLVYTQKMQEQLVEGEFEVTVFLKPNGKIAKVKMGEDRSVAVHSAVKEAMGKIDKILYRGPRYEGESQILIPIKLSVH